MTETIERFFDARRRFFAELATCQPRQMSEAARQQLEVAKQLRREIVENGGEPELRRAEILAARKVAA